MPRPNAYTEVDPGADGLRPSSHRRASSGRHGDNDGESKESKSASHRAVSEDLQQWENRLSSEVDEDLFDDPKHFDTLHRVIDVLGLQLIDDAATTHSGRSGVGSVLGSNPAYRDLQRQQEVVEEAIEHMAMAYCTELNGSVIRVSQVARRFNEAVSTVRTLRRQVRDIQDTIGSGNPNEPSTRNRSSRSEAAANAMSLRELWLKKLECESVLSLLNKLDIIRAAPSRFDRLIQPPCRIGAAVLCLSQALATMFSDDVAQVQALHKIMEQLMLRKQKAEELIWDTLSDLIFLRTANGSEKRLDGESSSVDRQRPESLRPTAQNHGAQNPFFSPRIRLSYAMDDDEASVDSQDSGASLFSVEDYVDDGTNISASATSRANSAASQRRKSTGTTSLMDGVTKQRMMIPIPVIEAELDLEADERRCLEQSAALYGIGTGTNQFKTTDPRHVQLPRYADPVLSLRILVECLANLRRLDDVERILNENLEYEIRRIVQREQARTFARLERRRGNNTRTARKKKTDLKDFRRHWTGLLSAFGCVMLRLSHLAQILRFRMGAEDQHVQSTNAITSTMHSVITSAYDLIQREIKDFLKACIEENTDKADSLGKSMPGKGEGRERGLFSLGIIDPDDSEARDALLTTRKNVMEMPSSKFVNLILFPQTKTSPQVHHALTFRRSLDQWTSEVNALKKELAAISGQDTSAPSYNTPASEEPAIVFLDKIIQNNLLPVLQQEAVDGTVVALEMSDAFDPLLDRAVFSRPSSSAPMDVEMSKACQVLYSSTASLFIAIHRLPDGGDMYLPMISVLEHVVLTFLSRVKAQVAGITDGKIALRLLMDKGKGDNAPFSMLLERRGTFTKLMRAYDVGGAGLIESTSSSRDTNRESDIAPLDPPASDTDPRYSTMEKTSTPANEEIDNPEADVEREEAIFAQELVYLRPFLDFLIDSQKSGIVMCTDEELTKAACLAHSLLKVSSLLEGRLQVRGNGYTKTLSSTRALREAIKTLKQNGIKMAKFCRIDMLLQTISKLSKICKSSTLIARDAVRIPSSVNELGEYMTGSSDYLREAAGNAVTAYTFSCLEQYIPLCLMETVRVISSGQGIIQKSPLTMNGIEALDRSGSVLYRDLKGATSFDNSFWDVELAAVSFERSASLIAMMELEMEELCAYYSSSPYEFAEEDFELMFAMDGPRRRGDLNRYQVLKQQMGR